MDFSSLSLLEELQAMQNFVTIFNRVSPSLMHVQRARIVATLVGHAGRVNCVKWLPVACDGKHLIPVYCPSSLSTRLLALPSAIPVKIAGLRSWKALASGAADSSILVWIWCPDVPQQPWHIAARLNVSHSRPQLRWLALMSPAVGAYSNICCYFRVTPALSPVWLFSS